MSNQVLLSKYDQIIMDLSKQGMVNTITGKEAMDIASSLCPSNETIWEMDKNSFKSACELSKTLLD